MSALLPVLLAAAGIAAGLGPGTATASGQCGPGWELIAEYGNSFIWEEGGLFGVDSVSWTGHVELWEEFDAACFVTGVVVAYNGPAAGGTLILAGDPSVSFTVQHPTPFTAYADVDRNAYGDLVSWHPEAGDYLTHKVVTNFDINGRGADEFVIKGKGLTAVVAEVYAKFDLPLDLVGETVVAQVHVGPDQCQCSVTYIDIPGETAPPAPDDTTPPATVTDLDVSSTTETSATLRWTAPGDDGMTGTATWYDLRYTTSGPITDSTFYDAIHVDTPPPSPAGSSEEFTVLGLDSGTTYWFALRASDEVPNWSEVSNTVSGTTGTPAPPPDSDTWSVYIHAHDDDWQLFQSPTSVYDYQAGYRLLFVYVTAGDAGLPSSYWQGREEGAMASVQYVVGTASDVARFTTICYTDASTAATVCHDIWQRDYGTTISFFMRLPDGSPSGEGFASTNSQSLAKLRDGLIPSITAVDGSTTYTTWRDLYLTVGAIVSTFAPNDPTTLINAPDFDRERQTTHTEGCPDCPDHSDHLATADAVYAITIQPGAPWSRRWFINYPLAYGDPRYPPNLSLTEYQTKRELFMAYNDRLRDLTGFDTYAGDPLFYERCFERNYFRVA